MTPTDKSIAPVLELRPTYVDSNVVSTLELLLERARKGDLLGLVVLYDSPSMYGARSVGKFDTRDVLIAFEEWKFATFLERG